MNTTVVPSFELTPTEARVYFNSVENTEKKERAKSFVRRGMNRRQDHGTRGNSINWDSDYTEWKISAAKRRDFRAAGRQISGM